MNRIFLITSALCFLAGCSTLSYAKTQPRSFSSVQEFLVWADSQLKNEKEDNLVSSQTLEIDTDLKAQGVKKMKQRLGDRNLVDVFDGISFPEDTDTFKLGGHEGPLRHIHIDFRKVEGSWYLSQIWMCR